VAWSTKTPGAATGSLAWQDGTWARERAGVRTGYVVAIDGPAGAGKSTIARQVAERLGIVRVDTGAIYRAVALVAEETNARTEAEVAALLPGLGLHFEGVRVFLKTREVSEAIRAPEISARASQISAFPAVRQGLLELQRTLGRAHPVGALLEGRDIGTVVFPDAEVKIFLTASAQTRAERRAKELEQAGHVVAFEEVLAAIEDRDRQDQNRPVAPLKPAADSVTVDSTGKSFEQVVEEVVALVDRALQKR